MHSRDLFVKEGLWLADSLPKRQAKRLGRRLKPYPDFLMPLYMLAVVCVAMFVIG